VPETRVVVVFMGLLVAMFLFLGDFFYGWDFFLS
jgi:hypothetical protein